MYTRNTTIVSSSAIQVYFIGEKADISLRDILCNSAKQPI